MEIIMLIIAGVVLYMLYNSFGEYMKNPYKIPQKDDTSSEYKPSDNPYIIPTNEDRIKKTEFGILTQILALIAKSDGKVCELENELLQDLFEDMAKELNEYNDYEDAKGSLQKIFDETSKNSDLDALANAFVEATKGEYKKRVKVIEFLLALAYADGNLDEVEKEKIIDVAAIFELNNDDFNDIYDDFESKYNTQLNLSKENALKLLGLSENFSSDELEMAYHNRIKDKKQNIFKSLNKSFDSNAVREIDEAYKLLKDSAKDSSTGNNPLDSTKDSNASDSIKDSNANKSLDSTKDS